MDTVLPHQYQYQYRLIVITPSDLPLPSGFCHPQFSDQFFYYYYEQEKDKVN